MGISLEKTNPTFRRLVAEATGDRRDNHAANSIPAKVSSKPAASLDGNAAGKAAGATGRQPKYRIEFTLYACQPLDFDNATGSIKEILDAIVTAGWLPGDDWRTLEGEARSVKVRHKAEQRTVAILRRIA